jgi:beta-galactosidase/beta-glucuronidase
VAIKGKSCILALPHSNITFRATSVKLYFTPTTKIEDIQVKFTSKGHAIDEIASKELATLLVKRGKGRPRKNPNITIFLQDNNA